MPQKIWSQFFLKKSFFRTHTQKHFWQPHLRRGKTCPWPRTQAPTSHHHAHKINSHAERRCKYKLKTFHILPNQTCASSSSPKHGHLPPIHGPTVRCRREPSTHRWGLNKHCTVTITMLPCVKYWHEGSNGRRKWAQHFS